MSFQVAFGHYVMGLVFFIYGDSPATAAGFLVAHATACAALAWRRLPPTPLIALGALAAMLGTQGFVALGPAGPVCAALGCAAMNVALADLLAATAHPGRFTLRAQAFVAAGNGTAPVLWGLLGTPVALGVAAAATLAVTAMAVAGGFGRARPSVGQGGSLGVATVLSGLAVGSQVVLVGSVPALLGHSLAAAATVGGGAGIVIGRVAASRLPGLVRPGGMRAMLMLGGLCSVAMVAADSPVVAGTLALIATASIGPMFPLALAGSYGQGSGSGEPVARGPALVIATASLMAAFAPAAATALADQGIAATLVGIAALLVILGFVAPSQYHPAQHQEAA